MYLERGNCVVEPTRVPAADFDKEHMPTLDQVNEVMDGLTILDAHLQARPSLASS